MSDNQFNTLLALFRQTLHDCRQLYLSAGQTCVDQHCLPSDYTPDQFMRLMDDLHKGLLVKVFVSVGAADGQWSGAEQTLAVVLFRHLWERQMSYEEMRQALQGISDHAARLSWYSLIRFFDRMPLLRDRTDELDAAVMRLANILAKVDGTVSETEKLTLRTIQGELDQVKRISLDGNLEEEEPLSAGQAVQAAREDTRELRSHMRREDHGPAPVAKQLTAEETLAKTQKELDDLIGMQNIKDEIRTLSNYLQLQQHRIAAGLPQTKLSLHQIFAGNPGTGKTTVARIVGQLLGALGVLKSGHLVETDRSGLVAEYAGQTGPKTNKKIDEALDGVLFIDEAYSLVSEEGDDPFGREAVQTLLKRMEDDRQRLVVILAGYPDPMDRLLKSNPGLSSRFNSKFVFEDYGAAELGQIFQAVCDQNHFKVDSETMAKVLIGFKWLFDQRDEHFGNGRMVRNSFENAVRRLADRIASKAPVTKELLTQLHREDLNFPEVPADIFENISERRFAVRCPGCQNDSNIPARYVGKRVKCAKCNEVFSAWGDPCER